MPMSSISLVWNFLQRCVTWIGYVCNMSCSNCNITIFQSGLLLLMLLMLMLLMMMLLMMMLLMMMLLLLLMMMLLN